MKHISYRYVVHSLACVAVSIVLFTSCIPVMYDRANKFEFPEKNRQGFCVNSIDYQILDGVEQNLNATPIKKFISKNMSDCGDKRPADIWPVDIHVDVTYEESWLGEAIPWVLTAGLVPFFQTLVYSYTAEASVYGLAIAKWTQGKNRSSCYRGGFLHLDYRDEFCRNKIVTTVLADVETAMPQLEKTVRQLNDPKFSPQISLHLNTDDLAYGEMHAGKKYSFELTATNKGPFPANRIEYAIVNPPHGLDAPSGAFDLNRLLYVDHSASTTIELAVSSEAGTREHELTIAAISDRGKRTESHSRVIILSQKTSRANRDFHNRPEVAFFREAMEEFKESNYPSLPSHVHQTIRPGMMIRGRLNDLQKIIEKYQSAHPRNPYFHFERALLQEVMAATQSHYIEGGTWLRGPGKNLSRALSNIAEAKKYYKRAWKYDPRYPEKKAKELAGHVAKLGPGFLGTRDLKHFAHRLERRDHVITYLVCSHVQYDILADLKNCQPVRDYISYFCSYEANAQLSLAKLNKMETTVSNSIDMLNAKIEKSNKRTANMINSLWGAMFGDGGGSSGPTGNIRVNLRYLDKGTVEIKHVRNLSGDYVSGSTRSRDYSRNALLTGYSGSVDFSSEPHGVYELKVVAQDRYRDVAVSFTAQFRHECTSTLVEFDRKRSADKLSVRCE